MTVDLAKIYATVKQRAERDSPFGNNVGELAEIARVAAKEIMFAQTLASVRKFSIAERKWLRARSRELSALAPKFEDAIRSGDFACNYRTVNNINTGFNPESGWIYILISKNRRRQVKIGCTKNEVRRRLLLMRRNHDPHLKLHWMRHVRFPSELEGVLHRALAANRVAGNTSGESNEWFFAEKSEVEAMVIAMLEPGSKYLAAEIKYSHDPEAIEIVHLS